MASRYPLVPLGEVLRHRKQFIQIDDLQRYRRCRVQLRGQGVVLRDEVEGALIKTKQQQVCHAGEFLVAEIDAKLGGYGLVPPELESALVSSHYFLFEPDEATLDRRFLAYYAQTAAFHDQVAAQGSTNYAAIRPRDVLSYRMPLPPLSEQRRVVARIEVIAAKVEEAQRLRRETQAELDAIVAAAELRIWPEESLADAPRLSEITTYLSRGRQSAQGDSDHTLIKTQHVQSGKYVESRFTLAPEVASKVSVDARVRAGDVLIACSAAGCLGRVAPYHGGGVASTDTHVAIARADTNVVIPEYLYAYLRGAQGQVQLRSRERGDWTREKVGFRLTELNANDLKQVPVPVPALSEQRRIVEGIATLRSRTEAAAHLTKQSDSEIGSVIPAVLGRAFRGEL